MDVVALAQHEIFNAVATLGTATTPEHLKKLFRMVPEVIFCFDGDQAGRQAAERALDIALATMEDGRRIRFMFLPQGEDPDTLVRREGKEAFINRVDQATPLPDFFFESLKRQVDIDTLDGKALLSKLALKKLQPMPNGVLRQLMLDQLAQLSNLSLERLLEFVPASNPATTTPEAGAPRRQPPPGQDTATAVRRRHQPSQSQMLSPAERATLLLLHYPQFVSRITLEEHELEASDARGVALLMELIRLLRNNPNLNPGGILGYWQGAQDQSMRGEIARLAATELPVKDPQGLQAEFSDAIQLILSRHSEKDLDSLLEKAKNEPLSEQERQNLTMLLNKKHRLAE